MTDPQESIVVSTRWEESRAIIALSGELDLHSSPQLGAAVEEALARDATSVEIDAGTLSFADSAGLRALLLARNDAEERGVSLKLTRVSEPLGRLLEMTGLRQTLGVPVT
jgi:anti-sigma B factor antagonist